MSSHAAEFILIYIFCRRLSKGLTNEAESRPSRERLTKKTVTQEQEKIKSLPIDQQESARSVCCWKNNIIPAVCPPHQQSAPSSEYWTTFLTPVSVNSIRTLNTQTHYAFLPSSIIPSICLSCILTLASLRLSFVYVLPQSCFDLWPRPG